MSHFAKVVSATLVVSTALYAASGAQLAQKAIDMGIKPIPQSNLEILKLVDDPKTLSQMQKLSLVKSYILNHASLKVV